MKNSDFLFTSRLEFERQLIKFWRCAVGDAQKEAVLVAHK